jgi:hypothetical protein
VIRLGGGNGGGSILDGVTPGYQEYRDPMRTLPFWQRMGAKALSSPFGKAVATTAGLWATPQRAVLAGVQGLAESERFGKVLDAIPATSSIGSGLGTMAKTFKDLERLYNPDGSKWQPTERESTMDRSWWDRTSDFTYGFGDVFADVSGGGYAERQGRQAGGFWTDPARWADRAVGLSGDILTDPTIGIGLGGKTLGVGSRIMLASRAEAAGLPLERVAKIAQLGDSILDDAERALLKQRSGAIRNFGIDIPGTTRAGRAVSRTLARGRNTITSSRPWQSISRAAPEGLEKAYRVLRTGKAEDGFGVLDAVAQVRYVEDFTIGQNMIKTLFGQEAARITADLKPAQLEEIGRLYEGVAADVAAGKTWDQALTLVPPNDRAAMRQMKEFFDAVHGRFTELGGNPGYIENYLPHMMTREFWEFLNGGSPQADELVKSLKIDLTAGPGILKTRVWKKGTVVEVNGTRYTLQTGDIAEINRRIGTALGFNLFEENVGVLMTAYVEQASRGIGVLRAMNGLTENMSRAGRTLDSLSSQELDEFAMAAGNADVVRAAREVLSKRQEALAGAQTAAREVASELADEMVLVYTRQLARVAKDRLGARGRNLAEALDQIEAAIAETGSRRKAWSTTGKQKIAKNVRELQKQAEAQLKQLEKRYKELDDAVTAANIRLNGLESPMDLGEYNALLRERVALMSDIEEARRVADTAEFLESSINDLDGSIAELRAAMDDPDAIRNMAQAQIPDKVEKRLRLVEGTLERDTAGEWVRWSPEDLNVNWLDDTPEQLTAFNNIEKLDDHIAKLEEALAKAPEGKRVELEQRLAKAQRQREAEMRKLGGDVERVQDLAPSPTRRQLEIKVKNLQARIDELEQFAGSNFAGDGEAAIEAAAAYVGDTRRALNDAQAQVAEAEGAVHEASVAILRDAAESRVAFHEKRLSEIAAELEFATGPRAEALSEELVAVYESMNDSLVMLEYLKGKRAGGKGKITAAEQEYLDAMLGRVGRAQKGQAPAREVASAKGLVTRWKKIVGRTEREAADDIARAEASVLSAAEARNELRGVFDPIEAEIQRLNRALDHAHGTWMRAKARQSGDQSFPSGTVDRWQREWLKVLEREAEKRREAPNLVAQDANIRRRYGKPELSEALARKEYMEARAWRQGQEDALAAQQRMADASERIIELEAEYARLSKFLGADDRAAQESFDTAVAQLDETRRVSDEAVGRARRRLDEVARELEEKRRVGGMLYDDMDELNKQFVDAQDQLARAEAFRRAMQDKYDIAVKDWKLARANRSTDRLEPTPRGLKSKTGVESQIQDLKEILGIYQKQLDREAKIFRLSDFEEVDVAVPADPIRYLSDIDAELQDLAKSVPLGAGGEPVSKASYGGDINRAIEQETVAAGSVDNWLNGELLPGGYVVPRRTVQTVEAEAAAVRATQLDAEIRDLSKQLDAPRMSQSRRDAVAAKRAALVAERDAARAASREVVSSPVIPKEAIDAAPAEVREAYLETLNQIRGLRERTVNPVSELPIAGTAKEQDVAARALAPFLDDLKYGQARLAYNDGVPQPYGIMDRNGEVLVYFSKPESAAIERVIDLEAQKNLRRLSQLESSEAPTEVWGALAQRMSEQDRTLARANRLLDFMSRYHAAVQAGAKPGPDLANRVTEEIVTRAEKALAQEHKRLLGMFDDAATREMVGQINEARRAVSGENAKLLDMSDPDDVAELTRRMRRRLDVMREEDRMTFATDQAVRERVAREGGPAAEKYNELVQLRRDLPHVKGKKKVQSTQIRINMLEGELGIQKTQFKKTGKLSLEGEAKAQFDRELNYHIDRIDQYEADLSELDRIIKGLDSGSGGKAAPKPELRTFKLKRLKGETDEQFLRRMNQHAREQQLLERGGVNAGSWNADQSVREYWAGRAAEPKVRAALDAGPANTDVAVLKALRRSLIDEKHAAIGELLQTVYALTGNRIEGRFINGGSAVNQFLKQVMGRDRELARQLRLRGLRPDSLSMIKSFVDRLWEGRRGWADDAMKRRVIERVSEVGETLAKVAETRRGLGVRVGGEGDGLVAVDWRSALIDLEMSPIQSRYGSLVEERRVYDDVLGVLKGDLAEKQARRSGLSRQLDEARAAEVRQVELEGQLADLPGVGEIRSERAAEAATVRDIIDENQIKQLEVLDMMEERYALLGRLDAVAADEVERLDVLLEQQKAIKDGVKGAIDDMAARQSRLEAAKKTVAKLDPEGAEDFDKLVDQVNELLKGVDVDPDLMPGVWLQQRWLDSLQQVTFAEAMAKDATERLDSLYSRLAQGDPLVTPIYKKVFMDVVAQGMEVLGETLLDEGSRVAVSSELAKQLKNLERAVDSGEAWKLWDASLRYFKRWATARPGFAFRNFQSASYMNFTDGVNLNDYKIAFKVMEGIRKGGRQYYDTLPREWQQALEMVWGSGASGRFSTTEVGLNARTKAGKYLVDNPYLRMNAKLGEVSEGWARLAMAVNSVKRGDDVRQGVARITRIHFDYTRMSKLDKNMKRIIPFWVFMSKNAPLQVHQMLMRPKAYMLYGKFVNSADQTREGDILPEWITARLGFKIDDTKMLNPDLGFTQLSEDVSMVADPMRFLSNLAPMAKVPLEIATKRNFFFGRDTSDMSVRDRVVDAAGNFNPQLRDFQRLLPGVANKVGVGEPRYEGREAQSWLSWFGIPIRQLTPESIDAELRRRAAS